MKQSYGVCLCPSLVVPIAASILSADHDLRWRNCGSCECDRQGKHILAPTSLRLRVADQTDLLLDICTAQISAADLILLKGNRTIQTS